MADEVLPNRVLNVGDSVYKSAFHAWATEILDKEAETERMLPVRREALVDGMVAAMIQAQTTVRENLIANLTAGEKRR